MAITLVYLPKMNRKTKNTEVIQILRQFSSRVIFFPIVSLFWNQRVCNTVVHDFNGHEVNGIHGLNGKKCYDKALYLANNKHDFTGMQDPKGNFPYHDFFPNHNYTITLI